jgi:hypothetical protein
MSDIPLARAMLYDALEAFRLVDCKICIRAALVQMTRKTPEFRVAPHNRPMTRTEVAKAKAMRRREVAIDVIAQRLGHNIGRISEAINGKRKGVQP